MAGGSGKAGPLRGLCEGQIGIDRAAPGYDSALPGCMLTERQTEASFSHDMTGSRGRHKAERGQKVTEDFVGLRLTFQPFLTYNTENTMGASL